MRLATSDVEAVIKRLAIGYGKPMGAPELAQAVPVWRDVLDGVPWLDLERAVDEAIRQPSRFMPKPGEIRAAALRAADGGQRRQYGSAPERWATEPWEPGRGPDGEPLLCAQCGGDVTFVRTRDGGYLGRVAHRPSCGTAPRIERAKGDFGMPAASDQERLAKQAERRAGWFQAAADEAKRKAVA